MEFELPEDVDRCPTCGKFIRREDGYCDYPPGGHYSYSVAVNYCNESCANAKPEPCTYEPDMEATP